MFTEVVAGAEFNGAPTAISHLCPGCPCAGFKGPAEEGRFVGWFKFKPGACTWPAVADEANFAKSAEDKEEACVVAGIGAPSGRS